MKTTVSQSEVKKLVAAHDYYFKKISLEEALKLAEINKSENSNPVNESIEDSNSVPLNESKKGLFEAHVICGNCGSIDLKLSRKKSKLKCSKCGNIGLTESIQGME